MHSPFNGLSLLLALGGTISACHHERNPCDDVPAGTPVAALPVMGLAWWVATARSSDGGINFEDLRYCCSPRVTPGCEATCPPPVVEFYEIGPPCAGGHCVNPDFPPGGTWQCFVLATDGGVLACGTNCYD